MPDNRLGHTVNGVALQFDQASLALVGLGCGENAWLANPQKGESVWQLHVADAQGQRIDLDGSAAESATAWMDDTTLRLEWLGVRDPASGAGPFDVRVGMKAAVLAGKCGAESSPFQ